MSLRIKLVDQAEKAYFNYLELGQKIIDGLRKKLQSLDLSNTVIIVCENKQWHIGLVKFVAQIINEEYGKPTLLLSANLVGEYADNYVYGYFCSSTNNNLFSLFPESSHLLKQYQVEKEGVHLVLALENISLFTEIITQKIRKSIQPSHLINQINIDLKVNINEVNKSLYQQLKLLEPYSLDNPLPKLLIENCQLIEVKHSNLYNKFKNKSARFKKTSFKFIDNSTISSVEGIWWGHYAQEIDQNQHYDLIGEVEFNTSENKQYYYFRLLDLKIHHPCNYLTLNKNRSIPILDYRGHRDDLSDSELNADVVKQCPRQWQEIRQPYHNAIADNKTLVLAYEPEQINNTQQLWLELMGMIKYLIKTKKKVTIEQLSDKLKISNKCLLKILSIVDSLLDVQYNFPDNVVIFSAEKKGVSKKQYHLAYQQFVTIIKQENLHKQYFYQVSIQDLNREI